MVQSLSYIWYLFQSVSVGKLNNAMIRAFIPLGSASKYKIFLRLTKSSWSYLILYLFNI